ncbi:thioesterase family protein [Sphingomonas sp. ST-64]|uniref:Thioesterase family protein n=1 Tax=Sphingomonas plantiphila TaxID=3163295 RepID=A0ABW8YMK5_9SPHN
MNAASREGFAFSHRLRVRYAEIDGQKVVFNSRYLEYADVALSEYWRWLKLSDLPEWRGMEFHVARAVVEYKAPFRYDEKFDAFVRTDRIGRSSLTSRIELVHARTGALHTVIELVYVNVDLDTGRSAPVPDAVRARMQDSE